MPLPTWPQKGGIIRLVSEFYEQYMTRIYKQYITKFINNI